MWASGSFSFPHSTSPTKPLSIGDTSVETTRISKIEYKPKKDLVFVHQEKVYKREDSKEVLVKETRVHVFRRPLDVEKADLKTNLNAQARAVSASTSSITTEARPPPSSSSSSSAPPPSQPNPDRTFQFKFTYTPTPSHLFRFSALTFNGHKIHYDPIWTREVEGHPNIVVHGPLTALLLMECVGRWIGIEGGGVRDRGREEDGNDSQRVDPKKGAVALRHFEYRAISPMYADGTPITFYGKYLPNPVVSEVSEDTQEVSEAHERQIEVWAEQAGKVGMRGMATIAYP
jgi:hydroxyacyl-ACP dehydratase HTD2-like protein with hotdog domain